MTERTDGERLAVIETKLEDIEGKIDALLERIADLERWKWIMVAIGCFAGGAFGFSAKAIAEVLTK